MKRTAGVCGNASMYISKVFVIALFLILVSLSLYVVPFSGTHGTERGSGNLPFTPDSGSAYTISFSETGLPAFPGTSNVAQWQVNLSGVVQKSVSTIISYTEPDATYHYRISVFNGFAPSNSYGNVTVNGANVNVPVQFLNSTHLVSFAETGLGVNSIPGENTIPLWGINISDAPHALWINKTSASQSLTFNLPNGEYNYSTVNPSGFYCSPETGTLNVSGTSITVNVQFSSKIYQVIFSETGLFGIGKGSSWSVTLSGGSAGTITEHSSTSSIEFSVENGSYSYQAENVPSYQISPQSGNFVVNGENYNVPIYFSKGLYRITFNETGLPTSAGPTSWGIKLVNKTTLSYHTEFSQSDLINFTVPNGTYSYTTIVSNNFSAHPFNGAGNITVNRENQIVPLFFRPTYFIVKFVEKNLPKAGTNVTTWGVKIGTLTQSSSGPAISFYLPRNTATLTYTINVPRDYTVNKSAPTFGTFNVPSVPAGNTSVAIEIINVSFNYSFSSLQHFYDLTSSSFPRMVFEQHGLPTGTRWTVGVNVSGNNISTPQSSSNASIFFNQTILKNFTATRFYFSVYDVGGYEAVVNANGTIIWNQTTWEIVNVTFVNVQHLVRFFYKGLPQPAKWKVNIESANGTITNGTSIGEPLYFNLTNGTYRYVVSNVGSFRADNNTGIFTVSNKPLNFSTVFINTVFTVNFYENGLPSGSTWTVNLVNANNSVIALSNTGGLTQFNLPNGTYFYAVFAGSGSSNFLPSPDYGYVSVNGTGLSVSTNFSNSNREVTFLETGLPAGTSWSVMLNGVSHSSGGTGNVTFYLPNGTYYYAISLPSGYTSNVTSGVATVIGQMVTVHIEFNVILYNLTVSESGLPTGNSWTLYLNGKTYSVSGSSASFLVPNGTYYYMALPVSSTYVYYAVPAGGYQVVSGHSMTVNLNFNDYVYNVTFYENTLNPSADWSVTLNGLTKYSSGSQYVNFTQQNGSYYYNIGTYRDYSSTPASGTVTLSGQEQVINVDFRLANMYAVKFTAINLPLNYAWGLSVSGPFNNTNAIYTTSQITLNLPNGSYVYRPFSTNTTYKAPVAGAFTVNGNSVNITLAFTKITYTAEFKESGLKSGTNWTLILNGVTQNPTNGSNFTFNLTNGSYTYRFVNVSGYHITSALNGTLIVNGSSAAISVTYALNQTISRAPPPPPPVKAKPFTLPGYAIVVIIAVAVVGAGIGAAVVMQRKKKSD